MKALGTLAISVVFDEKKGYALKGGFMKALGTLAISVVFDEKRLAWFINYVVVNVVLA